MAYISIDFVKIFRSFAFTTDYSNWYLPFKT